MVVFKMRDSVPSASYSSVCNVLRQWNILLIPSYRVYRLYDIYTVPIITAGHRTNVRLFTGNVRPHVTWPDKNVRAPGRWRKRCSGDRGGERELELDEESKVTGYENNV